MTAFAQAKEPAGRSAAASDLAQGKTLFARSRLLGRVSAFIFLLAALAVLDALQTLVRHEFNSLDLIAGETLMVSGMMPADARTLDDLTVEYEGAPGLAFEPLETYKGFWMGGFMWRANLTADAHMRPGKNYITIVDVIKEQAAESDSKDDKDRALLYGGRQNPALVYAVSVWPSEEARRAADNSLFRRFTGLPAFGVAAAAVLLAVAAGALNWFAFSRAEKILARHGIFYIYGVKDLAVAVRQALPGQKIPAVDGYKAIFSRLDQSFAVGDPVLLLNKDWDIQARGGILEVERFKAHARFAEGGVRPRYGWFIQRADTD